MHRWKKAAIVGTVMGSLLPLTYVLVKIMGWEGHVGVWILPINIVTMPGFMFAYALVANASSEPVFQALVFVGNFIAYGGVTFLVLLAGRR